MSTTQTTAPAGQVTPTGQDTDENSTTEQTETRPTDTDSRPLPQVEPDHDAATVDDRDHDGPVIPCELPEDKVPLVGTSHDASSTAMRAIDSGQLHRLMARVLRYVERREGSELDHELVDRWVEEGRHPMDLANGARDHELGALALSHALAEHFGVERETRVAELEDGDDDAGEQATIAAFNGGETA